MRLHIGIVLVLLGIVGTGGFYLALYLQDQLHILVAVAIVIAFLTWFGSGADIMGLLREWYKDKQAEKFRPKFDIKHEIWEHNHPLHTASGDIRVLTLKVDNVGGGQTVKNCSARIEIKDVIEYDNDALNWLYKESRRIPDFTQFIMLGDDNLATAMQFYANNWNVPIRKGFPEYIDILFTRNNVGTVRLLDADHTTVQFNREYNITITVVADDLEPKKVHLIIEIPNWNDIQVKDFHVV
jgi:hypothetical protein